jgi:G3E family GTPase
MGLPDAADALSLARIMTEVESFQFWSPAAPIPPAERCPITILSGFLGAGKSTLLNHLLHHNQGKRLAVLVNDFGSINLDADWIRESIGEKEMGRDQVLALQNGCVCCSLQSELLDALLKLHLQHRPDHLLIECTGIAEPRAILSALHQANLLGVRAVDFLSIANAVSVIDGRALLDRCRSEAFRGIRQRHLMLHADARRPIDELVMEQLECADLLVVNKSDLLAKDEADELVQHLKSLNSRAEVIFCEQGALDPERIFGQQRFDLKQTPGSAVWQDALGFADAGAGPSLRPLSGKKQAAAVDYGLKSLVYRSRKTFDESLLLNLLRSGLPGVLRAKGFFWSNREPDRAGFLSLAGATLRLDYLGLWWHEAVKRGQASLEDLDPRVLQAWQEPYGDRRQELVLIGVDLDETRITRALDACLLPES